MFHYFHFICLFTSASLNLWQILSPFSGITFTGPLFFLCSYAPLAVLLNLFPLLDHHVLLLQIIYPDTYFVMMCSFLIHDLIKLCHEKKFSHHCSNIFCCTTITLCTVLGADLDSFVICLACFTFRKCTLRSNTFRVLQSRTDCILTGDTLPS